MRAALLMSAIVVIEICLYYVLVHIAIADSFSTVPRWPWVWNWMCFLAILFLPVLCMIAIGVVLHLRSVATDEAQRRGFDVIEPESRDRS